MLKFLIERREIFFRRADMSVWGVWESAACDERLENIHLFVFVNKKIIGKQQYMSLIEI